MQENYLAVTAKIGKTYCVVKSDAYGHGDRRCAAALHECGARNFVVSDIKEAMKIRSATPDSEILVLGYTPAKLCHLLESHRLTQSVFSVEQMRQYLYTGAEIRVHAKINSGMNRLGFGCDESGFEAVSELTTAKNLRLCGLFTHYATAAEPSADFLQNQYAKFTDFCAKIGKNLPKHSANSAAAIRYPETRMDISRVGLILYGNYPCPECETVCVKSVMQLQTHVCSLNFVKKGEPIGYGCDEICDRDALIATLPIGYANGLLRTFKNHVNPCIRGQNAKIVGKICMDRCMIDLTELAENGKNFKVGDEVDIFRSGAELKEIADRTNSINYELITSFGKQNHRNFIK